MIYVAQFFSVFLGVLVITKTYHDFKKRRETLVMCLFWIVTWLVIISIALYPDIVEMAKQRIGAQGTGMGTFLGMSFVFLFFIIYRIYNNLRRIERQLKDIVTKIGLRDLKR